MKMVSMLPSQMSFQLSQLKCSRAA